MNLVVFQLDLRGTHLERSFPELGQLKGKVRDLLSLLGHNVLSDVSQTK